MGKWIVDCSRSPSILPSHHLPPSRTSHSPRQHFFKNIFFFQKKLWLQNYFQLLLKKFLCNFCVCDLAIWKMLLLKIILQYSRVYSIHLFNLLFFLIKSYWKRKFCGHLHGATPPLSHFMEKPFYRDFTIDFKEKIFSPSPLKWGGGRGDAMYTHNFLKKVSKDREIYKLRVFI